jgi:ribose 5-phosphate isomerase RpiB
MKVALLNDNSQVSKNSIIYNELYSVCKSKGYDLFNYGMSDTSDAELTYVQLGLLSCILLTSKAVDFIITGCGTGQGAMMALNSFPGVFCGLVIEPTDAYLFSQINSGNAISIPYAKGFGWGAELNLRNIFETLFKDEFGNGYPKQRAISEKNNREKLKEIKTITTKDLLTILKSIDQEFLYNTINNKYFKDNFFEHSKDEEVNAYLKEVLNR